MPVISRLTSSPHIPVRNFLINFPTSPATRTERHSQPVLSGVLICKLVNTVNPFLIVKQKPRDRFIKYIPPKEHIFEIMMVANPNHRDFIRTIYYSLARRGEIVNLLVKDVDLKRRVLTLHTKKRTGEIKARRVRMVEPLIEILAPRCALGNEYVFVNPATGRKYFDMNTVLPRLCKKAEKKPFTFHAIRHYGASYLASIGRPVKEIQQILGHSELRTTEVYLQDLADVAEVAIDLEKDPFSNAKGVNEGVKKACKILNI